MSATERISVGEPMPTVRKVVAVGPSSIEVTWSGGKRRGKRSIVDLAPIIFSRRVFAPLRNNRELFCTVHVVDGGDALAWGDNDQIDIAATALETLADESMVSADFASFLRRHSLSYDAAAAQLGIRRRLIAYYAKERQIPRYIALACAYLDQSLQSKPLPYLAGLVTITPSAIPLFPVTVVINGRHFLSSPQTTEYCVWELNMWQEPVAAPGRASVEEFMGSSENRSGLHSFQIAATLATGKTTRLLHPVEKING